MKKSLLVLVFMLLLSLNSYASVSNYKYNNLVDDYNDLNDDMSSLEKKYNKLATKYNKKLDVIRDIKVSKILLEAKLDTTKHNLRVRKANACGNLRIEDVKSKKRFPTISGIKEHGDYVDLDLLDNIFNEALLGESKKIGHLFDVMYEIRRMENKINKEYLKIATLSALNDEYLGCLYSQEGIHDLYAKKWFGNAKKEEFSALLDVAINTKKELSRRLDAYSFEVNQKFAK